MQPRGWDVILIDPAPQMLLQALTAAQLWVQPATTLMRGEPWIEARMRAFPQQPLLIICGAEVLVAEGGETVPGWKFAAALRQRMLTGTLAACWLLVVGSDPTGMAAHIGCRVWDEHANWPALIKTIQVLLAAGMPQLHTPFQHLIRPSSVSEQLLLDVVEQQYWNLLTLCRETIDQLSATHLVAHARATPVPAISAADMRGMLGILVPALHIKDGDKHRAQRLIAALGGSHAFRHWLTTLLPHLLPHQRTMLQLLLCGSSQTRIEQQLHLSRRQRERLQHDLYARLAGLVELPTQRKAS